MVATATARGYGFTQGQSVNRKQGTWLIQLYGLLPPLSSIRAGAMATLHFVDDEGIPKSVTATIEGSKRHVHEPKLSLVLCLNGSCEQPRNGRIEV